MDIYDTQAVQKVWQRVRGGMTEEKLEDWISRAMGLHRSYLALQRRGQIFRRMAQEEADHIRRLQGLRWLRYGRRGRIYPHAAEGRRSYEAALRSLYEAEQTLARDYQAVAQEEELFRSMAETAKRHCRQLQEAASVLVR